jgi:hypothetical protein
MTELTCISSAASDTEMSAWDPADWLALAGVAATASGTLATLGGVRLGARMASQQIRRRDAETALVAVQLASYALDLEDLTNEDLIDDSLGVDRSEARLKRINESEAVRLAHDAIISLIARREHADTLRIASELDARLSTTQQLVAAWYSQRLFARRADPGFRDGALADASRSLAAARGALDELHAKMDAYRQLMLGHSRINPGPWLGLLGRDPG